MAEPLDGDRCCVRTSQPRGGLDKQAAIIPLIGNVKMTIKLPAKPGPATGTMEATGCGRDLAQPLPGTVELVPAAAKK